MPAEAYKDLPIDFELGCRNDFAVAGARAEAGCIACGDTQNPHAAIDGSRASYAEIPASSNIGPVETSGVVRFRATLPAGATLPGGSVIGAILRRASGTMSETFSFATYLGGVPQEYFPGTLLGISGNGNYGDHKHTQSTRLAFDAVEIIHTVEGPDVTGNFRVYEFCSE